MSRSGCSPSMVLVATLAASSFAAHAASWSPGGGPPFGFKGRAGHKLAYDSARGRVVLFGGYLGVYLANDTWEYDGLSWTQGAAAPAGLTPRYFHAMGYDAGRSRVVLIGGADDTGLSADTWEYDGSAWQGATALPAAGRAGHGIAYDSGRSLIVLFGGIGMNDTWEYDGTTWTAGPAAPAGLTPRDSFAMAYDAGRAVTVIFGGEDDVPQLLDETWEYDGTAWTAGPAAPPPLFPRAPTEMAYDPDLGRIVLFGGTAVASHADDTWEYDGVSWTAGAATPAGLTARGGHAMAFASAIGSVILFGGENDAFTYQNDTWHYSCLTLGPATLPQGEVGTVYGQSLTASGGTPPYTFTLVAGTLPPGLSLSLAGVISGTPTQVGTSTFTVRGNDSGTCSGSLLYTLEVVCSPSVSIVLSPPTLPGGTVGAPYGQVITASGGTAPYTFAVTAGALPTGLSLSSGGVLSGTPTAAGSFTFTVTATDVPGCTGGRTYTVAMSCPAVSISPQALPAAAVGVAYAQILTGSGGTAPYTFAVTSGALPPGLALAAGGTISGTPTVAGIYAFTATATDAYGCTGSRGYTLQVNALTDFLVGQGLGQPNPNHVRVYDPSGAPTTVDFYGYAAGQWGVNVAGGDVDAATTAEIVTGPGPGPVFGPQVRGFGSNGSPIAKINYYAYGTLKYGVNAAAARFDGDAASEILSGAGPGAVFGPHVRGWNYDGISLTAVAKVNYFAYSTLKWGVNVQRGDVDGDGYEEILTGPGPGSVFGPTVRGFNYDGISITSIAKINFNAFSALQYGVNLAGGDFDGDGFSEIACAPGPGPTSSFPSHFLGFNFDGTSVTPLNGFDVTPYSTFYGGRVGAGDVTIASPDGRDELITGAGRDPFAPALVNAYSYDGSSLTLLGNSFTPFSGFYGVNVASVAAGY